MQSGKYNEVLILLPMRDTGMGQNACYILAERCVIING